jgi:hypothetical protein
MPRFYPRAPFHCILGANWDRAKGKVFGAAGKVFGLAKILLLDHDELRPEILLYTAGVVA